MVELRWVERGVEYYPINEGQPARYVKVLQYRTMQTIFTFHGKAWPIGRKQWGAWCDVPEAGLESEMSTTEQP